MRQIVTSLTDPESSELLESGDIDGGGGEFLQDDHGVDDDALDLDEIKGDEKAMLQWKPDSMVKVPLWQCPRSAPTPRLLRARLTVLAGSALPVRGRPTGCPATASGARASRLQSRPFPRL